MSRIDAALAAEPPMAVYSLNMEVSATPLDLDRSLAIHEVFEKHAQSHPSFAAVVSENESLSYFELKRYSDAIANSLSGFQVEGLCVGVLHGRSINLLASVLGVMKAGGAYFPLDSLSPIERLRFMVEDAAPRVILTEKALLAKAEQLNGNSRILILEDLLQPSASSPVSYPLVTSSSLAYTIYTSGSTGTPKGVLVEHGSLSNFLAHMSKELAMRPGHKVFAMAPVAFDASVFELLLPLYCGGTSVILPRSVAADAESLIAALAKHRPRVVMATPATWQVLMNAGWKGLAEVQCISGGEALNRSLAEFLRARTQAVWNHYGPTETTIAATSHRVTGDESIIPLGRAISGYELLVLDEQCTPVAPGQVGELYIGGIGVSRGYLNRPEQTSARFLERRDNFGCRRFYRTGDLVRLAEDDTILFTGRTDNQIKIRGLRVELEEIENIAQEHPDVLQISVVAKRIAGDDERLVGYVVGKNQTADLPDSLRLFLSRKLPHYMVPALFIVRDGLPITGNGKVDRAALQAEALEQEVVIRSAEGTADELEKDILLLWRQLPQFQAVGLDDNFFNFGGHSLLGARLIAAISRKCKRKLPLSVLFEAPTVRQLAQYLRSGKGYEPPQAIVTIRPDGTQPALFCIHGIEGNVLGFENLSFYLQRGRPIFAVQATRLQLDSVPGFSIETLATEYIEAMKEVRPVGPYILAGYSAGGVLAFEMARQLLARGEKTGPVLLLDSYMYSRRSEQPVRLQRSLEDVAGRFAKFFHMDARTRWASFRKNWAYYSMIWVTRAEVNTHRLLRKLHLPVSYFSTFRTAFAYALDQYEPQPVPGKVVVFRAEKGDSLGEDDTCMGWEGLAAEFEVIQAKGEHLNMLFEPNVLPLARQMDACLPRK